MHALFADMCRYVIINSKSQGFPSVNNNSLSYLFQRLIPAIVTARVCVILRHHSLYLYTV